MNELKCNSCGYEGIVRFLELGEMPPVNAFIGEEEIANEEKYPLNLAYCPHCFLVQLGSIVPPDKLFRNYLHLSAGSESNVKHLKEAADYLKNRFNINKDTKLLEIGSNDGTLLSFIKNYTEGVVGVDPAKNLAKLNEEKGINYIAEFFDTKTASKISRELGKFDIIVGLNVIPHTPNNIDLLKGARIVLKDKGVLMMEGVYALETILRGEFDTIYHEHAYTFSLHSLISLFRMAGLSVVDVEKIPTQGGSLRVFAMKDEFSEPISETVKSLLEEEDKMGLASYEMYDRIGQKVEDYKREIRNIVDEEKKKHGKLIGLGAPARGVVIMNYCGLNKEDIDYVVDDTVLKHGKVMPGVHIPVKPFDSLENEKERDFCFILLSWNYKESFVRRLKEIFPKFRMIVPFPKLEVIEYG